MHCLMRNVLFFVFVLIGNFVVVFFGYRSFLIGKKCIYPIIFGIKRAVQNGWLICMLTAENLLKHSNFDWFL